MTNEQDRCFRSAITDSTDRKSACIHFYYRRLAFPATPTSNSTLRVNETINCYHDWLLISYIYHWLLAQIILYFIFFCFLFIYILYTYIYYLYTCICIVKYLITFNLVFWFLKSIKIQNSVLPKQRHISNKWM